MLDWLRAIVERSPILSSLNYGKGQLLYHLGLTHHHSGMAHSGFTIDQSIDYIVNCYNDYVHYGGVGPDHFRGKSILEVGPGDNLGIALYMVAKGARHV